MQYTKMDFIYIIPLLMSQLESLQSTMYVDQHWLNLYLIKELTELEYVRGFKQMQINIFHIC